ncbi:two-component system response regulator [Hwanghaeella sp.]|uniref:two-component system response regulator n=1 Tax=Hwanghaeella sp. TaxID=2605943 RepID=UPI003CCBF335
MNEDFLSTLGDETAEEDVGNWRILVVDDDKDVHEATELVLKRRVIQGRKLELLHAYDAKEALEVLRRSQNVSVILLDVVMETPTAGLDIVERIRNEFEMTSVRIILRTGQPGYAPETDVIERYDINDYHTKSELTAARLVTSITAALRAFQQVETIEASKAGLAKIVSGSSDLLSNRSLREFAEGVLLQINRLLDVKSDEGIVVVRRRCDEGELEVLAWAGKGVGGTDGNGAADDAHVLIDSLEDGSLRDVVREALDAKETRSHGRYVGLFIGRADAADIVVALHLENPLQELDRHLLEVFTTNIATGFDNIDLFVQMQRMANRDALTGAFSRTGLLSHMRDNTGEYSFVVLIDIDDFQNVNDGLGIATGNSVLVELCDRLTNAFPGCLIARLYADVFAVVFGTETTPPLADLAPKLDHVVETPIVVNGDSVALRGAYGASEVVEGLDPESVIQRALLATKQAKVTAASRIKRFDAEMETLAVRRREIASGLQQAIEKQQFEIHYQPIISMATMQPAGFEALIRWHSDDGPVSPGEFIPIAETSGMIIPMGIWLIDQVAADIDVIRTQIPNAYVSINVSGRQIEEGRTLTQLRHVLGGHSWPAETISVEITESLAMEEESFPIADRLNAIRDMGMGLSIDDFGTGHSSLVRLKEMPVTQIKIDRSFVLGMESDNRRRAIVRKVIDLARELDLDLVAEGIETEDHVQLLQEFGCPKVQGYYFGRPMPLAEALDHLKGKGT